MHKPILNQTPRTPLQVLRDVTFGLLIRELKTRFGSYRLGYAWALLDPLLIIGAFSLIFGILVSTLLTLVVIPVLYYSAFRKEHQS